MFWIQTELVNILIRYLDARGHGYVRKKDFRSLLEDTLGCFVSTQDFDRLVEKIGLWEDIWVPYPKFLVMFENNTACKSPGLLKRVEAKDLKVDDAEIEKVCFLAL